MLQRKELEALAVAIGRASGTTGADLATLADTIITSLLSANVVTPHYDAVRFWRAIDEARPVPYTVA
jgi:hypothetical protein